MRIRQEIQAVLWQDHTALNLVDPPSLRAGMQDHQQALSDSDLSRTTEKRRSRIGTPRASKLQEGSSNTHLQHQNTIRLLIYVKQTRNDHGDPLIGGVGRSDRAFLCAQSAVIEGDGDKFRQQRRANVR